jgi:hypothetical protein
MWCRRAASLMYSQYLLFEFKFADFRRSVGPLFGHVDFSSHLPKGGVPSLEAQSGWTWSGSFWEGGAYGRNEDRSQQPGAEYDHASKHRGSYGKTFPEAEQT